MQGEAIAFALGGNSRMMRARNLGALVNHATESTNTAGSDMGAAQAAAAGAEVVLHFNILAPGQPPGQDPCSAGSASGSMNNNAEARVQSDSSVPAEEVAGRLLIRRRVSRAGRSDLAVLQLPPQPAGPAANAGGSGEEGNGKAGDGGNRPSGGWRAVTPAALGDLLAPFGLQTEAVDR